MERIAPIRTGRQRENEPAVVRSKSQSNLLDVLNFVFKVVAFNK